MTSKRLAVPSVFVEPGIRTGMPVLVDNPKEVGADRIADAVAAFERYGGPTIVVDFGTATNFEVVSEKGEYLGGVLFPGVEVSLDALTSRAALLPRVDMSRPRSVLGKSTVEQLQSGIYYGFAAVVEGVCAKIKDEVGPATVVATGGLASIVLPATKVIDHHEPWLTLYGLRTIYPPEPRQWLRTALPVRSHGRARANCNSALPRCRLTRTPGRWSRWPGRIMLRREMGKLTFMTLTDWTGSVQLFCGRAVDCRFAELNKLSLGDWVGATGEVVRTRTGELSVRVAGLALLAEARRPFPDKWRGITDIDTRYRQRYADMWANERSREVLLARSRAVSADTPFPGGQGLRRSGDARFPYRPGRRDGKAIRYPPQRPRYGPLLAHRARTSLEATGRGRNGEGFRDRACIPQRGPVSPPQPRVHNARALPGVRRLPRHDGLD